jgi:hypothetical protein
MWNMCFSSLEYIFRQATQPHQYSEATFYSEVTIIYHLTKQTSQNLFQNPYIIGIER